MGHEIYADVRHWFFVLRTPPGVRDATQARLVPAGRDHDHSFMLAARMSERGQIIGLRVLRLLAACDSGIMAWQMGMCVRVCARR